MKPESLTDIVQGKLYAIPLTQNPGYIMRKRFSQSKNEWSETRENQYKSDSLSIAFNLGFELIERDTKVYKLEHNLETLICEPDKPKSLWYETWLKLRKLQEIN